MQIAKSARDIALDAQTPEERQHRGEEEVVKVSLQNLLTFPWILERVRDGRLELHGAWFAIRTGELMLLQENGTFAPVPNVMPA